jgi:hypothetical protein
MEEGQRKSAAYAIIFCPTARNLLILIRRDVRVVEGARLEIDSVSAQ